jgi:hypothetical protein
VTDNKNQIEYPFIHDATAHEKPTIKKLSYMRKKKKSENLCLIIHKKNPNILMDNSAVEFCILKNIRYTYIFKMKKKFTVAVWESELELINWLPRDPLDHLFS